MSTVYPILSHPAVRDNIDDEDLTDIDDEVFIRDGRNGSLKLDDDGSVKRPLMPPRRKCKKPCDFKTRVFPCRALLLPVCYGIAALTVLIGLIILCIFTANMFPMPLTILRKWLSNELKNIANESNVIPCTSLASKVIWTKSLPKLTSEAPLRSMDVNNDGIKDIIVGFSTGLDTMDAPEYICALYFENQVPCLGGVLALNGKTGETLWTHWTAHAIFAVDCGLDLTDDKITDCVISGRGGILHAINGRDGSAIWKIPLQDLSATKRQRILDVYDARIIADIDGDDVGDVIASHAIQSRDIRSSEILLISGKNGNILQNVPLPDTEQLFIAPQILVHPDGENIFILATNSQIQAGGLYVIPQSDLIHADAKLRKLPHNTGKGTLLPPILVDVTLDGVDDVIVAMFNSSIIAYDGLTFDPLWNYTIPNSEVISIPIPGYYNDDEVPDFMVKHQIGLGFPTYYYTVATVIDGRNGTPLLEKPIEDSLSRQMSGLTITVEGFGNDWFLHWSADCLSYEGVKEQYQFLKGQSLVSQTRADLCKIRFNSTLTTKLLALSQHVAPPGIPLYSSEDWQHIEFNNSVDPRKEEEKYLELYPGFEVMGAYADTPLVSERSPKVYQNREEGNSFKHEENGVLSDVNEYPEMSDIRYESSDNYQDRKKDVDSTFQADSIEDFGLQDNWRQSDKWNRKNAQSRKEYDESYDRGSNTNDGVEEQNVEYLRKTRERRNKNFFDTLLNDTRNYSDTGTNYLEATNLIANSQNSLQSNFITNETIFKRGSLRNRKGNLDTMINNQDQRKLRKKRIRRKLATENNRSVVNGVERQPPTGILLPSFLPSTNGKSSVDLIFSTFWLPPSEISIVLLQEDLNCIHRKKALAENTARYKGSDDIISECLSERGVNYKKSQEEMDRENVKVALGQMTIYRMRLECVCPEDMLPYQSCKNISSHQSWPEHLGPSGSGYFKPLHKQDTLGH